MILPWRVPVIGNQNGASSTIRHSSWGLSTINGPRSGGFKPKKLANRGGNRGKIREFPEPKHGSCHPGGDWNPGGGGGEIQGIHSFVNRIESSRV